MARGAGGHLGQNGREAIKHALDVDVDHAVPFIDLERRHQRQRHDAGIVYDDVDITESLAACLCEGLDALPVGDVKRMDDDVGARAAQFFGQRLKAIQPARAEHQFCAGGGQLSRNAFTYPARCTRDENNFVQCHGYLLAVTVGFFEIDRCREDSAQALSR